MVCRLATNRAYVTLRPFRIVCQGMNRIMLVPFLFLCLLVSESWLTRGMELARAGSVKTGLPRLVTRNVGLARAKLVDLTFLQISL